MAAKARLAIVGGVAAVVAVLAVYALVAGIQGSTNGISVNEEKRGKGTVETLEFKNPVTIRLIDKDGNVASETVVYNDITDEGRQYILRVLGDDTLTTTARLDTIRFTDSSGSPLSGSGPFDVFDGPAPDAGYSIQITTATETCTSSVDLSASPPYAECTATFTFYGDGYKPSDDGTLTLATGRLIQTGNGTTPYFELGPSITFGSVNAGTVYSSIQITWRITVS